MPKEPTLQEAAEIMERIRDFFESRLVGIVYTMQRPGHAPERHCVASGFISESHGYPVFVTAGHALDTIFRWAESGHRKAVSFIVPTQTKKVAEVPWTEDLLNVALHWYDDSGDLDFGIVPVSDALARALHINDVGLITRHSCWKPGDERKCMRLLIGFSGEHLQFTPVEQFVIPAEAGKWKPILKSEFSGIASRLVWIASTCPCIDGSPKIIADPLHDETPSVAGLSGGFIVDVFFGEQIQGFSWVGVQSKETRVQRGGKDYANNVTFIDSRIVIGVIDNYIGELKQQHPDLVADAEATDDLGA